MNLHPLIPNHELPKCLLNPLIIGNPEQIKALKTIKKDIEDKLAQDAKIESGELKSFDVTISFEGFHTITVYAENASQAEKAAIDRVDFYDCLDIETCVGRIRETNKEVEK